MIPTPKFYRISAQRNHSQTVGTINLKTYMIEHSKVLIDIGKRISEAAQRLNEFVKELKQEGYTFLDYDNILLKNGWLIPYDLMVKDVMLLAFQFENNQIDEADKYLIKFFKKEKKRIEKELIEKFPERTEILKEAFKAHQKGMFHSSTILFISQSDGITDNNIFMGKKFRKFAKQNESHPLAELFNSQNPLTSTFYKERKQNKDDKNLNRHGIIHGLMLEYGTELNSFKALSLLYFVSNFRNKFSK